MNQASAPIFSVTDRVRDALAVTLRGCEELIPQEDWLKKLVRSEATGIPLRIKLGLDPTAPDIHIGHTVVLNKMRQLQDLGHTVIFLIGDFTTLIGDPSGRNTTRPPLTREQIEVNAQTYYRQASMVLDPSKTEIRYNSEWGDTLGSRGIIELAAKYTVARMMERDGIEKMSKSKNNYIGISEDANTMFAKVLSISDVLMWRWYTLLSFQSEAAIAALKAEVVAGRNPKDAKVALAKEITARFHSHAAAESAEQDFINRSKGGVPDEIPAVSLPLGEGGAPIGIGAVLKMAGLAVSSGEGNRLIDGGGVRIDSGVVSDKGLKLGVGTYVLQVGKRKFAKVTVG
jgi:tyrosyl-tRNA synthetase